MKKSHLKLFIAVAAILVVGVAIGIFASWKYFNWKYLSSKTETDFSKVISRVFEQEEGYGISDSKTGQDITEEFISEYADLYHAGKFDELDDILTENGYSVDYTYGSYTPSDWGEPEYGEIPTPFR